MGDDSHVVEVGLWVEIVPYITYEVLREFHVLSLIAVTLFDISFPLIFNFKVLIFFHIDCSMVIFLVIFIGFISIYVPVCPILGLAHVVSVPHLLWTAGFF